MVHGHGLVQTPGNGSIELDMCSLPRLHANGGTVCSQAIQDVCSQVADGVDGWVNVGIGLEGSDHGQPAMLS